MSSDILIWCFACNESSQIVPEDFAPLQNIPLNIHYSFFSQHAQSLISFLFLKKNNYSLETTKENIVWNIVSVISNFVNVFPEIWEKEIKEGREEKEKDKRRKGQRKVDKKKLLLLIVKECGKSLMKMYGILLFW